MMVVGHLSTPAHGAGCACTLSGSIHALLWGLLATQTKQLNHKALHACFAKNAGRDPKAQMGLQS